MEGGDAQVVAKAEDRPITSLRQKKFVALYPIYENATRAARDAGYSEKTARQKGHELLKDPRIRKAIDKECEERLERLRLKQDTVLLELLRIGKSKITDIVELNGQMLEVKDLSSLPADVVAAIESIQETKYGFKIKLHPKIPALELLGKHLGMWQGKQDDDEDSLDELLKEMMGDETEPE